MNRPDAKITGLPAIDAVTGQEIAPMIFHGRPSMELDDSVIGWARRPTSLTYIRDRKVPELLVRFRPDSDPAFFLEIEADDRSIVLRRKIANCSDRTVAEAREMARRMRLEFEQRGFLNEAKTARRGITVTEVIDSYEEHVRAWQFWTNWRNRKFKLLRERVAPSLGTRAIASVRRSEWMGLIDRVSLAHDATGKHLHKAVRAFLGHAVSIEALNANPLARSKPPATTFRVPQDVTQNELFRLLECALKWREPWRTIYGLMIATGEAAEDVRQMQHDHIDFENADWFKFHRVDQGPWGKPDELSVPLNAVAMSLLLPMRDHTGFLFPSSDPRRPGQPVHVRSEIGRRIDMTFQHETAHFTARRITRAVRLHAFGKAKPTRETAEAWGNRLSSYLTPLDDILI